MPRYLEIARQALRQTDRGFGGEYQSGHEAKPTASPKVELRFGQPHAKLFPFIGRKVRTPAGPGTLIQVFAGRVTVLLESNVDKCAFFKPAEIEPVSWDH